MAAQGSDQSPTVEDGGEHLGADRRPPSRPPVWRVVAVALGAAAVVLWGFTGWTWWAMVAAVAGLLVVRLVASVAALVTAGDGRRAAARWAVVAVAGGLVVWLASWTSVLQLGVAAGVAGLVTVAQLSVLAGLVTRVRGRIRGHTDQRVRPPVRPPGRAGRGLWVWVAAGVSVALAVGCGVALWVQWRADADQRAASERQDRAYRVADMRPDSPLGLFRQLAKDMAQDDGFWVCWLFDDRGRAEFTAAVGADTCEGAVHRLHDQIETGRRGVYGSATVPAAAITTEDDTSETGRQGTVWVDGCRAYAVDGFDHVTPPGPKFGQLTMRLDPEFGVGYLITGWTPCGQDPPGKPSTSPSPPLVLPSYPPGIPGLLTDAIADRDPSVCEDVFTEPGRTAFAAMVGARSCQDAIEQLADQVTDPDAYATPSGITTSTAADSRTVVDACSMTWTRWGQPTTNTAGPQLGHLVLAQPEPGTPGYLIDDVQPC